MLDNCEDFSFQSTSYPPLQWSGLAILAIRARGVLYQTWRKAIEQMGDSYIFYQFDRLVRCPPNEIGVEKLVPWAFRIYLIGI